MLVVAALEVAQWLYCRYKRKYPNSLVIAISATFLKMLRTTRIS